MRAFGHTEPAGEVGKQAGIMLMALVPGVLVGAAALGRPGGSWSRVKAALVT